MVDAWSEDERDDGDDGDNTEEDHAVNLLLRLKDTLIDYLGTHAPLNRDVFIAVGELSAVTLARACVHSDYTTEQFESVLHNMLSALKDSARWNFHQCQQRRKWPLN